MPRVEIAKLSNGRKTADSIKAQSSGNYRLYYHIPVLQPHIRLCQQASQVWEEERRHKNAYPHTRKRGSALGHQVPPLPMGFLLAEPGESGRRENHRGRTRPAPTVPNLRNLQAVGALLSLRRRITLSMMYIRTRCLCFLKGS